MNNLRQFRKDFRTYILGATAVSDLIGNRLTSIRGSQQSTNPHVVMQVLDGRDSLAHDGPLKLPELRVQLSIYGDNSDSTDAVRDAIVDRLCPTGGINGVIGASTQVAWVILDNDLDNDEETSDETAHIIDFRIKLK